MNVVLNPFSPGAGTPLPALAMDEREVGRMRFAVRDYYDRFLKPKACAEMLIRVECHKFIVNAEEKSVPIVYPSFVWPPA